MPRGRVRRDSKGRFAGSGASSGSARKKNKKTGRKLRALGSNMAHQSVPAYGSSRRGMLRQMGSAGSAITRHTGRRGARQALRQVQASRQSGNARFTRVHQQLRIPNARKRRG